MSLKTDQKMKDGVLTILANDPDAWFNHFNPEVVNACNGNIDVAERICRELRKAKKVDAQGRGKWAQYGHKVST